MADSSSYTESRPLLASRLSSNTRTGWICKSRWRFQWIKSRGAMVVLLWIALLYSFDPASVSLTTFNKLSLIMVPLGYGILLIFYLVFPLLGLFANTRFGGYRVGVSCAVVALLTRLLLIIGFLVAVYSQAEILGFVMYCIGYIAGFLAQNAVFIVMLSVGMDQLIGASGEQMSAFIHWYYWCFLFGGVISATTKCVVANISHGALIVLCLHAVCLALILISSVFFRKYLNIEPVTRNPLRLVSAVIAYVRKHKYPVKRSALTYWENDYPSRFDLGKEKYGGPFTEEQVEDVKTFMRIAVLLSCMMIFLNASNPDQSNPHLFTNNSNSYWDCLLFSEYFNDYVQAFFMLLYLVVIYPFFYKCVPSMLRRIGFGIFLSIITEVTWISVDLLGHRGLVNETCVLRPSSKTSVLLSINPNWFVLPVILNGLAYSIAVPATLEFCVAQSPYSMRGLVVGVWFVMYGVFQVIAYGFSYLFSFIHTVQPSCEFYYYLFNTVIITLSFVLFVVLAKRYKLRRREDLFNPYTAVEQYFENEFDRREQFKRERDLERNKSLYDISS